MELALRFGVVVEVADRLTLDEHEELVEIVRKRMIAKRRGELLRDIEEAEYGCRQDSSSLMTANAAVDRLFS